MSIALEVRDGERVLQLRFDRMADRYAHCVAVTTGKAWETILSSVEGAATDAWPASPPLSDLFSGAANEVRHGATGALLGTGAAGKAYWSAAITPLPGSLEFDYACRMVPLPSDFIGCTYDISAPVISANDRSLVLRTAAGNVALSIHNAESRHGLLQLSGNRLLILPRQDANKTHRWKYRMGLSHVQ